jgi:hypothetical protein
LFGVAPDTDFGAEYKSGIKNLALRQKIKMFFIAQRNRGTTYIPARESERESFQEVIPFLRPSDQSEVFIVDDDPISTNPTTSLLISYSSIDKEILVSAIFEQSHHPDNDFDEEGKQTDSQTGHFFKRRRLGHHGEGEEIDFGIFFCDLVSRAGLEVLAVMEVFHLIDLDGSGTIDMKEFSSKCRVFAWLGLVCLLLLQFFLSLCVYFAYIVPFLDIYVIYMLDHSAGSVCTYLFSIIYLWSIVNVVMWSSQSL